MSDSGPDPTDPVWMDHFRDPDGAPAAGIPVLGPKARRAGLFSGGKVDVTLSVPERLRPQATLIVASHFPEQIGRAHV